MNKYTSMIQSLFFDTSRSDIPIIDGLVIECLMIRIYLDEQDFPPTYFDLLSKLDSELKSSQELLAEIEEKRQISEIILLDEENDSDLRAMAIHQCDAFLEIKNAQLEKICSIRADIIQELWNYLYSQS